MLTRYVWRNCLLPELKIDTGWLNTDVAIVQPRRQDLFRVEATPKEVRQHLMSFVIDSAHYSLIVSAIQHIGGMSLTMNFLISRNQQLIQYCPWNNLNQPGSLWERIGEVTFCNLNQLQTLARSACGA